MAIRGSVEIVRGDNSTGVVGTEWVPIEVPIVLRNLHGIRDMGEVEPEQRPTGRTPLHQWTGTDANNQPVVVMLWEDTPFDETAIGKTIAAELAKGS